MTSWPAHCCCAGSWDSTLPHFQLGKRSKFKIQNTPFIKCIQLSYHHKVKKPLEVLSIDHRSGSCIQSSEQSNIKQLGTRIQDHQCPFSAMLTQCFPCSGRSPILMCHSPRMLPCWDAGSWETAMKQKHECTDFSKLTENSRRFSLQIMLKFYTIAETHK